LPKVVEPSATPIMFADDTSMTVKSNSNEQLQSELNIVMSRINELVQENLITLNLNKIYLIQFSDKGINNTDIRIEIAIENIAKINCHNMGCTLSYMWYCILLSCLYELYCIYLLLTHVSHLHDTYFHLFHFSRHNVVPIVD